MTLEECRKNPEEYRHEADRIIETPDWEYVVKAHKMYAVLFQYYHEVLAKEGIKGKVVSHAYMDTRRKMRKIGEKLSFSFDEVDKLPHVGDRNFRLLKFVP